MQNKTVKERLDYIKPHRKGIIKRRFLATRGGFTVAKDCPVCHKPGPILEYGGFACRNCNVVYK